MRQAVAHEGHLRSFREGQHQARASRGLVFTELARGCTRQARKWTRRPGSCPQHAGPASLSVRPQARRAAAPLRARAFKHSCKAPPAQKTAGHAAILGPTGNASKAHEVQGPSWRQGTGGWGGCWQNTRPLKVIVPREKEAISQLCYYCHLALSSVFKCVRFP